MRAAISDASTGAPVGQRLPPPCIIDQLRTAGRSNAQRIWPRWPNRFSDLSDSAGLRARFLWLQA